MQLLHFLDNLLNRVTMYRLILYVLAGLTFFSLLLSFTGHVGFAPTELLIGLATLLVACYITNTILAKATHAPVNIESHFITALILYFLLLPPGSITEIGYTALTAVLAMGSKYILAVKKKHIFNPAAIAVVVTGYSGLYGPIWWPVEPALVAATAIGGLLIVRKIRRFQMIFTFFAVTTATMLLFTIGRGGNISDALLFSYTQSPLFFFATIMLTEPLTTPPTRNKQMVYASIVGVLYSFQVSIGPFYSSAEAALVIGNLYSFAVSSKKRLMLTLKEKVHEIGPIYTYTFSPNTNLKYKAGQYLEWTLPHDHPDARGNRRFFTIASSPTEKDIKLGVKFYDGSSSLKKDLKNMKKGEKIAAGQLAGDFTLPENKTEKMVWIAGGIGVTPFRSMTKYLLDTTQKRNIIFFHTARTPEEFAYKDIFEQANKKVGLKTHYVITEEENIPKKWKGETGHLTEEIIKNNVTNYKERTYYLSGAVVMVNAYKELLSKLGIPKNKIVTDYFPGFT